MILKYYKMFTNFKKEEESKIGIHWAFSEVTQSLSAELPESTQ